MSRERRDGRPRIWSPAKVLPLLCLFGRHQVDPAVCWNCGICFSSCLRCGRDLIRSGDDLWHIPKGHRVVWRPLASSLLPLQPEAQRLVAPSAEVPVQTPRKPADFMDDGDEAGTWPLSVPTPRFQPFRRITVTGAPAGPNGAEQPKNGRAKKVSVDLPL